MRCLSCHYDLRNLAEHRCPECGREFDPSDSSTYEGLEVPRRVPFKHFVVLSAVSVVMAVVVAMSVWRIAAPSIDLTGIMLLIVGLNVLIWTPIIYYILALFYRFRQGRLR